MTAGVRDPACKRRSFAAWLAAALLGAAGCGRPWVCEEPDLDRIAELPQRLSQTGLDAPGVVAYRPQFALWSDGADKRRWIALPAGGVIDTSDMDDWSFPPGTRLWKEFAVDGAPIETRMFAKLGPTDDDWVAVSYQWTADGSDAIAVPWGTFDVRAGHDIPGAGECEACHGGRNSRILGFSAIQLAAAAQPGEIGLAELIDRGLLSAPPAAPPAIPGDDTARAALGYLAANCGHCHNRRRPAHAGARCFDPENDYDFTLPVGALATVADTPAYRTAIGHAVMPGDPDGSKLIALVSRRGFQRQMPPLATEHVDGDAVALLRRWIEGL